MRERMLVIDDDTAVLRSCEAIFGGNGFDVETTNHPAEGLRLSSENRYGVILCDWKMPGFDGLDVIAELEERAPDSAVVMFSGYPSVDRATEAMKRGAMDFLAKPFTPDEITDVVHKAMQRKFKQEQKAFNRFEHMWDKFPSFMEAFIRAVGCNWMVCLAVWMALASRQVIGKIFAIFFPIMGFVAIGFEHCVANMYFIPAGIFLNHWAGVAPAGLDMTALNWSAFLVDNLLPVTIGNTIGGVVFVGLGYWGAYLRPAPHPAG